MMFKEPKQHFLIDLAFGICELLCVCVCAEHEHRIIRIIYVVLVGGCAWIKSEWYVIRQVVKGRC